MPRMSVSMDIATVQDIKDLDLSSGSIAETIRRALQLFKYVLRMRNEGYIHLIVRNNDGYEKHIILP